MSFFGSGGSEAGQFANAAGTALDMTTGGLCRTLTTKKRVTRRAHGHVVHSFRKIKHLQPTTLLMPTTITGQNGVVVQRATRISVAGCAIPGTVKRVKKARRGRR